MTDTTTPSTLTPDEDTALGVAVQQSWESGQPGLIRRTVEQILADRSTSDVTGAEPVPADPYTLLQEALEAFRQRDGEDIDAIVYNRADTIACTFTHRFAGLIHVANGAETTLQDGDTRNPNLGDLERALLVTRLRYWADRLDPQTHVLPVLESTCSLSDCQGGR